MDCVSRKNSTMKAGENRKMDQEQFRQVPLPESWAADWQIDRRLGSGAYSTVYRAVRRDLPGVDAAIKIISIPASEAETDSLRAEGFNASQSQSYYDDIARQYISEIELMEQLKGTPHIVGIEDYKTVRRADGIGNYIFIRMELLTPLDSLMRQRSLTEEEVIRVGIDICSALQLCEAKNILHRDIKPANIFYNDKTPGYIFYKLGDFGIARSVRAMTHGLSSKGTPNYMAPEVFAGKKYDQRADLYSLGVTLYRLLNNNRLPFSSPNDFSAASREDALYRRMAGEPLPLPACGDTGAARVVLKACEFDPDRRYPSAAAMRADLEALLGRAPRPVSPSPAYQTNETLVIVPERPVPVPPAAPAPEAVKAPAAQ